MSPNLLLQNQAARSKSFDDGHEAKVRTLHRCAFMDGAQKVVLIRWLADECSAFVEKRWTQHGNNPCHHRSRHPGHRTSPPKGAFFSTIELVIALDQGKARGKTGQIAESMTKLDLVILDELEYLPFSASGGALPFRLLSKPYERTSVVITTNLSFSEWATVFGDTKMTTALLDHLTHRSHILESGDDSFRFKKSSAAAARKRMGQTMPCPQQSTKPVIRGGSLLGEKTWLSSAWELTGWKLHHPPKTHDPAPDQIP